MTLPVLLPHEVAKLGLVPATKIVPGSLYLMQTSGIFYVRLGLTRGSYMVVCMGECLPGVEIRAVDSNRAFCAGLVVTFPEDESLEGIYEMD